MKTPWNKGKKTGPLSDEHRQRIGAANKGKIRTIEMRKKYSEIKKANPPLSMLGRRHSEETKRKMSLSCHGFPEGAVERSIKINRLRVGPKHHAWIADRNKLKRSGDSQKDRRSSAYNTWRKQVWIRDDFKCKIANQDCSGRIEAHHILGWTRHPELRYETNNGITLCHFHHPRKKVDEVTLAPLFKNLITSPL